jgi:hypothetical protein
VKKKRRYSHPAWMLILLVISKHEKALNLLGFDTSLFSDDRDGNPA